MLVSTKTETVPWFVPAGLDVLRKQTGLDRQPLTLSPSHADAICPWRDMLTGGISSSNI